MNLRFLAVICFIFCFSAFFSKTTQAGVINYCASLKQGMLPLEDRPVFNVKFYGVKGDGATDDTTALQKAFDNVPPGAVLEFPSGTYLHAKSLILSKEDTILRGRGGILKATNEADQTIVLKGHKAAIVGMTLVGTGKVRASQNQTTKILVKGQRNQVIANTIQGGASAGILVFGATDFRVAGNSVRDTLADGIHVTNGSRRGIVENNTVYHTGDDSIAVVSYVRQKALSGDILIRNNDVSDVSYGRGITVISGENVAVIGNNVSDITGCAGIHVSQETPSGTGAVRHVLVQENTVNRIIMPEKPEGKQYTGHGAIDINSYNDYPVEYIEVINNIVNGSRFAGIRTLGNVCHVRIEGNQMENVSFINRGGTPLQVIKNECAPQTIICRDNVSNGKSINSPDTQCQKEDGSEASLRFDLKRLEQMVGTECK